MALPVDHHGRTAHRVYLRTGYTFALHLVAVDLLVDGCCCPYSLQLYNCPLDPQTLLVGRCRTFPLPGGRLHARLDVAAVGYARTVVYPLPTVTHVGFPGVHLWTVTLRLPVPVASAGYRCPGRCRPQLVMAR